MPETKEGSSAATNRTVVARKSDRELVVTRTFNAPARIVFEAWSKPELFKQWWIPKSVGMSLLSCDMDIRTGGTYRLVFSHPAFDQPMAFFGTYNEVTPHKRLVWTNEESDQGAVTTVTFEENAGKTLVTFHELYPTTEALEEALAGSAEGLPEQFAQLDELLAGRS
ncbi:SRPBCC family protein [Dyella humi]|uniref:SRPBCC family protein n=1 Tax=Dyella humi TaxID=1770547 RepID=A0ABW8IND9_9GAMM